MKRNIQTTQKRKKTSWKTEVLSWGFIYFSPLHWILLSTGVGKNPLEFVLGKKTNKIGKKPNQNEKLQRPHVAVRTSSSCGEVGAVMGPQRQLKFGANSMPERGPERHLSLHFSSCPGTWS